MEEFNPDTAVDQFSVKKNQVQMMVDRGYNTRNHMQTDPNLIDDARFLTMTKDQMIISSYRDLISGIKGSDMFNAIYDNGKSLTAVMYLDLERGSEEVSKPSLAKYTQGEFGNYFRNPTNNVTNVVFIAPKKLNTFAVDEVNDLANFGIKVQVFTWLEMLAISPNHVYNGVSRIMTKDEEKDFVTSMAGSEKARYHNYFLSMPFFSTSDPIPKYYAVAPDSLISTTTTVFTHNSVLKETNFVRRVI